MAANSGNIDLVQSCDLTAHPMCCHGIGNIVESYLFCLYIYLILIYSFYIWSCAVFFKTQKSCLTFGPTVG